MIKVKRVYEQAADSDGTRVLIDRLWPRGISKEKATISIWMKDIAPSTELRRWFSHDPSKWKEFQERYIKELESNETQLKELVEIINTNTVVTLVYGAKDETHNNAVALSSFLQTEYLCYNSS
ncbi:DUF488 domain-containing protein [bacterium]|nr:DUF488 domain-containing protein [bacterium]